MVAQGPGGGPKGPEGAPLNRGAMTTFVFKKTPMELPDGVTFNDKAGQAVGLDQFAGKVVLLNLWATWCAPCRKEMPDLVKVQNRYGMLGVQVIGWILLTVAGDDGARLFSGAEGLAELTLEEAVERFGEGVVVIKAKAHRSQEQNRADALERLAELVRSAATPPKRRIPTRPGPAAKRRRLDEKTRRGQTKRLRSKPKRRDFD
mgnify:CR=1 FL=1